MTADFSISVVIPTLNASGSLQVTVTSLLARPEEILVIDGGSADKTVEIASSAGAKVIEAERGRGLQLKRGGEAATGQWLLFLHADTRLSSNWWESAYEFISDQSNTGRAAVFRFALDDTAPQARRIERLANWRSRALGLPYGDQGLLISREYYSLLGGYREMPLMEDVDIVRRIGRKHIIFLDAMAVTSAKRYRQDGWWGRPIRNIFCLTMFLLGASPRILGKIYG